MQLLPFLKSKQCSLGSLVLLTLTLSTVNPVQAQSSVDCLTTPSDPSCVSFQLPPATISADLDGLCTQMPYMPGCSLYKSCQAASKTDQWCLPFSILADICAVDMPMMTNCKNYVSLCGTSANQTSGVSRPTICMSAPMITSFPTTKNASALVLDICSEMSMDGCERCPKPPPGSYAANCDTLGTYAILCKAMPEMSQCATWKTMCSSSSDTATTLSFQSSEYCASGVGSPDMNPPAMRMYFHFGTLEYILFEKWVPRNQGQYVGACFALFFITLFFQSVRTYHNNIEVHWAEELALCKEISNSTLLLTNGHKGHSGSILLHWIYLWRQPWTTTEVKQNFFRAILTFVETTLGYALMLVTMTFNVPLFFSVVVGLTVGSVIFSRQRTITVIKSNGNSDNTSAGTGCVGCG